MEPKAEPNGELRETRPIGRPPAFREQFCDIAIQLGKEGHSRAQIAAILDVGFATLQRMEADFPNFRAAMIRARELSQAWWEEEGRKGINSRDFNANAYSLQVRNRFPESWKERTNLEVSGIDGGPIELAPVSLLKDELKRRGLEQGVDIESLKRIEDSKQR